MVTRGKITTKRVDAWLSEASIRPRVVTRGKLPGGADRGHPAGASIRPRVVTRGKDEEVEDRKHLVGASIRPRVVTRGKSCGNSLPVDFVVLQLGRAWSRAERRRGLAVAVAGRSRASIRPRVVTRGKGPTCNYSIINDLPLRLRADGDLPTEQIAIQ